MKNHLLIGISLLTVAQVVFSQPLKLYDDKTVFKFTFKNKAGTEIELTEKSIIEKKYEIKIRPSREINKNIKDGLFDIIFQNGKEDEEIVFNADQAVKKYKFNNTEISAVSYTSTNAENSKEVKVQCYEKTLAAENAEAKETKQTTECIKTEGCKSYIAKESNFELGSTPICIGSKESTIETKKSNIYITCLLWKDADGKSQRIEQIIETKDVSVVKSSDKCK